MLTAASAKRSSDVLASLQLRATVQRCNQQLIVVSLTFLFSLHSSPKKLYTLHLNMADRFPSLDEIDAGMLSYCTPEGAPE
jgi:hypothetical protein